MPQAKGNARKAASRKPGHFLLNMTLVTSLYLFVSLFPLVKQKITAFTSRVCFEEVPGAWC